MPIPRPRFTVRRLMIAVAVMAVLLSVGSGLRVVLHERSRRFHDLATEHFRKSGYLVRPGPGLGVRLKPGLGTPREMHHRKMWWKYVDASKAPWFPVPPDPPEPE